MPLLAFLALLCGLPTYAQDSEVPELNAGSARLEAIASHSTIDEKQLQTVGVTTSEEALRAIPGVYVSRAGGVGQPSFVFIRGGSSESTLVLLDGIALNDPSLTNRAFDFSTLTLENIERIEVWKGPQSVLFGQGATGGVVNIVTKKGSGPLQTGVGAEIGSYNSATANIFARGSSKTIAYSFGAERFQTNGFSAASSTSERDSSSANAFSSKLNWSLNESSEIELVGRYTEKKANLDFAPSNTGPNFIEADAPNYTTSGEALALGLKGKKTWSQTWRSEINFSRFSQERHYSNDPDPNNTASLKSTYTGEYESVRNINRWQHNHFVLAFGPNMDFETAKTSSASDTADFSVPEKTATSIGAFGRFQYDNTWIFVTEGFRFDQHRQFGSATSYELAPGVHLTKQMDLTFRYATGFKAPTLFQLYDPKFGNAALQPESASDVDITLTNYFLSRTIKLSGTVFHNRSKNLIQFAQSKYSNVGTALAHGLELESDIQFGRITLGLGYTYLETRDDSTGESLLRRPQNSLSGRLEFKATDSLTSTLEYFSVDHRLDMDPITNQRSVSASYQTLNASAFWKTNKNLSLHIRIINILNLRYEEVAGYNASPRAFYFGLTATR